MIVDRLEAREVGDAVERSAAFRWSGGETRVRIAVPAELAGDLDDASPFLPLALLPAMCRGEDLVVDGPVSPRLLRGASRARELYGAWSPGLHASAIEVAEERECSRLSDEIASFFSRGVDSTYSAAVARDHPGPLSRLVFVDGFEPIHDERVRAEEVRRARAAANRIGLPLTVLSASFFEVVAAAVGNADDITSPMLALSALALAGGVGHMLIPSGDSFRTLGPQGSTPVLDPLFSTEAVSLETDSVALGRVEKGMWLARERPNLLAELKVCFNENRPDNCGRCSKCLLTMATLKAAGRLEDAHQFPDEIDLDAVRAVHLRAFQPRIEFATLAAELERAGERELYDAVLEALDRPAPPFPGPPPRDDTPAFAARQTALITAVMRDRRPWPPAAPFAAPPGLGLVRAVDARAGRHVYGVGRVPPGTLVGELGSLPRDAAEGIEPLWIAAGGYLVTEALAPPPARPSALAAFRWMLAPLVWRDSARPPRARALAALGRARTLRRRAPRPSAAPVAVVAHLHRHESPGRLPLHCAFHPVTGDQLLATNEWEAIDMGYGPSTRIGWVDAIAPVTGTLDAARPPVPWASRFGQRVRRA